ncbi:MAG: hypothetical protein QOE45_1104 [Frankiaceae bacterium]|jgi:hypothetical protein|nr:hypothetical protein [Frankiaceae bacterium]
MIARYVRTLPSGKEAPMRAKLSLAAALAAVAGAALVTLNAGSSSALPCPPGTTPTSTTIAGQRVGACKPAPYPQCDPGPCDPTAAPPEH